MVRFHGEKRFAHPSSLLWARLTDPAFLVTCLPDLAQVDRVDADGAAFVLRPGFAFVRGTLHAQLSFVEKTPETTARYKLDARGIGSTSTVEVTLTFAPQDGGTLLGYAAEVTQLGGLLKLVPSGLISGAAQKVVADVLAAVEKNLAP